MYGRRQQQYGGGGYGSPRGRRGGSRIGIMLLIGLAYAGYALFNYYSNSQENPITGEIQRVSVSPEQEVAIGLQSAPHMVQQHGGLHPDQRAQGLVKQIGERLINTPTGRLSEYLYDFHLLADPQVVNAFALPGGQVFITQALFSQLKTEDQLAGVLGHEVGHVIHRHGAERMAKMELTKGLTGAAVMASGDYSTAQAAQMIGDLVNMKYGRDQELESIEYELYQIHLQSFATHYIAVVISGNFDLNAKNKVQDIIFDFYHSFMAMNLDLVFKTSSTEKSIIPVSKSHVEKELKKYFGNAKI